MAKDKKLKAFKNKVVEDKIVTQSQSTSSATEKKTKGSKKPETPPPDDENSHSPGEDDEGRDEEEKEDEYEEDDEDEKEDGDEEDDEDEDGDEEDDEDRKADHLSWPKSDDLELFKRIRKACPTGETMKYKSRVNNLDWELVEFQDYSADQCRNRWLHIQSHLRRYRILTELLDDALSWVDKPWCNFNKGAKNNQRHPEQPKKPLTSYMVYFLEKKDAVKEKHPDLGMVDVSKLIGKMFKRLSDQKKTKYAKIAQKEKEDYEEKMKKFNDAHPDYVPPKSKYAKAVAPRPPTPFNLFSDEKMEELLAEGVILKDARKRCRDGYKELKDIEKLTWIRRAIEQEHNYDEEFKKFQLKNPDVSAKQPSLLTKDELRIKDESMGKPIKPPHCGYSLFSQQGLTRKEAMTEIGTKWKELSAKKKASYNLKATEMYNSYCKKLASYNSTPEQRTAELIASRGQKRQRSAAGLKEQVIRKKAKSSAAADAGSSDKESENNGASDEDFEIFPKTDILKERKVNGQTVQKSLNEMPSTSKKSSASTSVKAAVKSTATALKSPERDSSSKKSAGNSDSKSLKLSPKSSRPASTVKSSEIPKTPVWAANQVLYKAEPPKPPESVAAYYVMTHHSKAGDLSSADIDLLWEKVSEKQKKKLMGEHEKIRNDYVQAFENYVRNLEKDELKAFRAFMKKRAKNDEDGEDDGDDDDDDEDDGSNDEGDSSNEDSEPNGSNEEQASGASSDED